MRVVTVGTLSAGDFHPDGWPCSRSPDLAGEYSARPGTSEAVSSVVPMPASPSLLTLTPPARFSGADDEVSLPPAIGRRSTASLYRRREVDLPGHGRVERQAEDVMEITPQTASAAEQRRPPGLETYARRRATYASPGLMRIVTASLPRALSPASAT